MNINELSSVKRNTHIKEELKVIMEPLFFFFSLIVKKSMTINYFFYFLVVFSVKDHPRCSHWTLDFEPTFSQRVYFPLSPRSLFPTRQRFPFPNHVTSGCMSPRSPFSDWSAVSLSKSRDFRLHEPAIPFFLTGQRFPPLKNT